MKYVCNICGWVYDEEETGVKWEDLPEDFACEMCGVGKEDFSAEEECNPLMEGEAKALPSIFCVSSRIDLVLFLDLSRYSPVKTGQKHPQIVPPKTFTFYYCNCCTVSIGCQEFLKQRQASQKGLSNRILSSVL